MDVSIQKTIFRNFRNNFSCYGQLTELTQCCLLLKRIKIYFISNIILKLMLTDINATIVPVLKFGKRN